MTSLHYKFKAQSDNERVAAEICTDPATSTLPVVKKIALALESEQRIAISILKGIPDSGTAKEFKGRAIAKFTQRQWDNAF